jgi:hypothetical protein
MEVRELVERGARRCWLADGEDDRDGVGVQSARHERERIGGFTV